MRAIPALAAVLTLVPRLARAVPSPPLPPPSPPPPSPPPEPVCAAATDCDNACACGVCLKELNASRCLETSATSWEGRATDATFCDHELQPLALQHACASAGECGTDGALGNCVHADGSAAAVYERLGCACASQLPALPPLPPVPPLPWGPPPSPLPPPPPEVGGQVSTGLVAAVAALCLLGTCVLIAARLLRSAQAPVAIPETTHAAAGSFRWQFDGMVLVE